MAQTKEQAVKAADDAVIEIAALVDQLLDKLGWNRADRDFLLLMDVLDRGLIGAPDEEVRRKIVAAYITRSP